MKPGERLAELNLVLPNVATPVGSYVPALRSGNHVLTSGQLPFRDGEVICKGKVPSDVSVEKAAEGTALAALNALAAVADVAGGIDAISRIVRVCVFVNSDSDFTQQPAVANGASDLIGKIFGDAGKHVRSAVGVAALPLDAAIELELVVEVV